MIYDTSAEGHYCALSSEYVVSLFLFKAKTLMDFNIQQENSESKNNNHEDAGVWETEMYHTNPA